MSAIVLLSGGLDSTVSLAIGMGRTSLRLALAIDYRQRAARRELDAARKIARHYHVRFQQIALPWIRDLTTTALVNRATPLPLLHREEIDNRTKCGKSARLVWVPNRNGLFINAAAAIAEANGDKLILTGFNAEEAATFPDNSISFVKAVNRSLSFSTLNHVRVTSYVSGMDKTAIVRAGRRLRVPFNLTWSCYEGGKTACGACESCLRRDRAFRKSQRLP